MPQIVTRVLRNTAVERRDIGTINLDNVREERVGC
jgi:hypothetical protein